MKTIHKGKASQDTGFTTCSLYYINNDTSLELSWYTAVLFYLTIISMVVPQLFKPKYVPGNDESVQISELFG